MECTICQGNFDMLFLYMHLRTLMLTVGALFSLYLQAQPPELPKYYFSSPVGTPMELSANFGELRNNHWHMGLDVRTNAKENQPIYAAADGYVASIGVRPGSFGRFIVINHPNGLSTLYAHLNDFYPELEKYVTGQQYKNESWAIELKFTKEQFPVSKGEFISFSGNTGGSQGPHLHFEIFDTKTEKRLNPLLLGFPIADNVRPAFIRLAMYDRSRSIYQQSPKLFPVKNTDSGYIIPKIPVVKTGLNTISFAIQAFDKMSNGGSEEGIYSARLVFDEVPQTEFILDSIDYDETSYINAHTDYKYRKAGGPWLQHVSKMPGDQSSIFKVLNGDGVIHLADTNRHSVRIEIKDAYNNTAVLNFTVQYYDSLAMPAAPGYSSPLFIPGRANEIKKPDFEASLSAKAVYDTSFQLYRRTAPVSGYAVSASHGIGDISIPLHDDITVRIKPDKPIPAAWENKLLMVRNQGTTSIRKPVREADWLMAKFGDFGTFQVYADLLPPQVNELGKGDTVNLSPATRIVFTPTDNFSVKSFRAELYSCPKDTSGFLCPADSALPYQWLRFTNDKSRNWVYQFDERCPYGVHRLRVTVEDMVGNKTTKEWWFKRYPYTPPPKKKKVVKKGSGKKTSGKKPVTGIKKKPAVKKK